VRENSAEVDVRSARPDAHGEHVHEEADQILGFRRAPVRHRRSHDDLLLSRVAQDRPRIARQERHVQRRALGSSDGREACNERRGPSHVERRSLSLETRRARAVRREGERRRRATELVAPPGELARFLASGEPASLPRGPVRVLNAKVRERARRARRARVVDLADLTHQDPERPAVRRDVVNDEKEDVLLGRQAKQARAQDGPGREIEGARRFLREDAPQRLLAIPVRGGRQVLDGERGGRRRVDHRLGAVRPLHEARAERFVACDDARERRFQGARVETPRKPHRRGKVVDGRGGLERVQEPEAALRERGRAASLCRRRSQRRRRGGLRATRGERRRGDRPGRRRLEEDAQRDLRSERAAHPRDHRRREQRVAAEIEESLVRTHAGDAEHLREDPADDLLLGRAGPGPRFGRAPLGLGQRGAIHLPVGRQRQGLEKLDRRGNHVLGQGRREVRAQLGGTRVGALRQDHVGRQPLAAARVAHGHRRPSHLGMADEGRLDLPGLDAVPTDLDLEVATAEEHQRSVRREAREIARAVQPRARLVPQRRGHEALRGEIRASVIAAGKTGAPDVDLAGHADRNGSSLVVEKVHGGVRDRPADGGKRVPDLRVARQRVRRHEVRLARTVVVHQAAARRGGGAQAREEGGDGRRDPELLAGGIDLHQARGNRVLARRGLRDLVERDEGKEEPLDLRLRDDAEQPRGVAPLVFGDEHDLSAGGERREDLLEGHVEGKGRELQRAGRLPTAVRVAALPGQHVGDRAMAHRDPLRPSGRARGVDDVREGVRRDRHARIAAVLSGDPLPLRIEEDRARARAPRGGPRNRTG
jgi:hypothetical protein